MKPCISGWNKCAIFTMEIGYVILQKNDEQVEWNDVQLPKWMMGKPSSKSGIMNLDII